MKDFKVRRDMIDFVLLLDLFGFNVENKFETWLRARVNGDFRTSLL